MTLIGMGVGTKHEVIVGMTAAVTLIVKGAEINVGLTDAMSAVAHTATGDVISAVRIVDIIVAAPIVIRRVITAGVTIAMDTGRMAATAISARTTISFTTDQAMIRLDGCL